MFLPRSRYLADYRPYDTAEPLLAEPNCAGSVDLLDLDHPGRADAEGFVRRIFARRYDADVRTFPPNLLNFHDEGHRRAVVGFRSGLEGALFSEQCLPDPAQRMIAERLGVHVERSELVEVGNGALEKPRDARWVLAAVTEHLYARGYRWIVFVATRTLFNTFRSLGLRPIVLSTARASRLHGGARHGGDYYHAKPIVCAGHIESGYRKLHRQLGPSQPRLRALLGECREAANPAVPLFRSTTSVLVSACLAAASTPSHTQELDTATRRLMKAPSAAGIGGKDSARHTQLKKLVDRITSDQWP